MVSRNSNKQDAWLIAVTLVTLAYASDEKHSERPVRGSHGVQNRLQRILGEKVNLHYSKAHRQGTVETMTEQANARLKGEIVVALSKEVLETMTTSMKAKVNERKTSKGKMIDIMLKDSKKEKGDLRSEEEERKEAEKRWISENPLLAEEIECLDQISVCFGEKQRSLDYEFNHFCAQSPIYHVWYYENALTELLDLELPKEDDRGNGDAKEHKTLKVQRREDIDRYISKKKNVPSLAEFLEENFFWASSDKSDDKPFHIAEANTVMSKLNESCKNTLDIDNIFSGIKGDWRNIVKMMEGYKMGVPEEVFCTSPVSQASELQDLREDFEKYPDLFNHLKGVQNQIFQMAVSRNAQSAPRQKEDHEMSDPMAMHENLDFEMEADIKPVWSSRRSPKKESRAAIKLFRKKHKIDAQFLKDFIGSTVSIQCDSLDEFGSFIGDLLDSMRDSPNDPSIFKTDKTVHKYPMVTGDFLSKFTPGKQCEGVRLLECKYMNGSGYKDVKLIFQACVDVTDMRAKREMKYYNFEMIFLLKEVAEAKKESHTFYEFLRLFQVKCVDPQRKADLQAKGGDHWKDWWDQNKWRFNRDLGAIIRKMVKKVGLTDIAASRRAHDMTRRLSGGTVRPLTRAVSAPVPAAGPSLDVIYGTVRTSKSEKKRGGLFKRIKSAAKKFVKPSKKPTVARACAEVLVCDRRRLAARLNSLLLS